MHIWRLSKISKITKSHTQLTYTVYLLQPCLWIFENTKQNQPLQYQISQVSDCRWWHSAMVRQRSLITDIIMRAHMATWFKGYGSCLENIIFKGIMANGKLLLENLSQGSGRDGMEVLMLSVCFAHRAMLKPIVGQ